MTRNCAKFKHFMGPNILAEGWRPLRVTNAPQTGDTYISRSRTKYHQYEVPIGPVHANGAPENYRCPGISYLICEKETK